MEPLTSPPFVSILMPVRNEAGYIESSLSAVLAQDYPADRMEVLVADGMSTDGTRQVVERLMAEHPHLLLVDNPGKIVPTGLNAALRLARGDILIRVDGHCVIAPDYVRRCVFHLIEDKVDGVGGPIETIGETWLARLIAAAMSSPFGVGDSAFRTTQGKSMLVDTVAFPAYSRSIVAPAGLYDEELVRNQDDEYNYRLRSMGAKILLAADVRSKYYSRSSFRSLWRQYFQYGYWKVRVLQKHPFQMRPRQFVPPVFVSAVGISSILAATTIVGKYPFLTLAGIYVAANLFTSVVLSARKEWKFVILLPVAFFILHASYGLGFLSGLLRFAGRWRDKKGKIPVQTIEAPSPSSGLSMR